LSGAAELRYCQFLLTAKYLVMDINMRTPVHRIRNAVSRVKRGFKRFLGKDLKTRPEIEVPLVRLGSDYGGWVVCTSAGLGPDSTVYSVGLGEDASFDLALIKHFGCKVFCFDPTPKSVAWAERQSFPDKFRFYPWGLAGSDGYMTFGAPSRADHVSYSAMKAVGPAIKCKVYRLSTIMAELNHSHVDLLKMDIEGAEYEVIEDITKSDLRPRQILVEFHHGMHQITLERTRSALNTLTSIGYTCFSISQTGREYSFLIQ
jgi:FkbM family methyltransferase